MMYPDYTEKIVGTSPIMPNYWVELLVLLNRFSTNVTHECATHNESKRSFAWHLFVETHISSQNVSSLSVGSGVTFNTTTLPRKMRLI